MDLVTYTLARGASSEKALYVEDVFSAYVYTGGSGTGVDGTSGISEINNGINLSTYGGLVWTRRLSSWLTDPMLYGIPQYVSDMVTLIARLNVSSVHWVGTSMGGLIGMTLASLTDSPIKRLVLNDVGASLKGEALARIAAYVGQKVIFNTREEAYAVLKTIFAGFGPHTDAQWEHLLHPMVKPISQTAIDTKNTETKGFELHYDPAIATPFRKTYAQELESGKLPADLDLWPIYDRITTPTLLLRGAQSDLLSAQTAREMEIRGPKARLVEFQGVGHAPTLMHADQIAVVREFLAA